MYSRNKHASIKKIVEKYSRAENAAARNNAAIRMAEGVQRNAAIRMAKGVQRNAEKRIMAVQQRDFEKLLRDLKPNSQRSIPNSNTLVQNAGKFNFSNQLKEVGFTLQPGGKSTTVLGGVTKQNKKANNFNKKANSNSNNLTTNSWRNTMRMITPKRMLLSLCYIAEDTQNLAKDLRKACRRKFFSSRARRNSHTT